MNKNQGFISEEQNLDLQFSLDSIEVESFVTGLNQYEQDAIDQGFDLSCTLPPSTPDSTNPTCC